MTYLGKGSDAILGPHYKVNYQLYSLQVNSSLEFLLCFIAFVLSVMLVVYSLSVFLPMCLFVYVSLCWGIVC